ncbi:acyl carrier protein [Rhizobium laguerreae]|uniref:acyl carrier protein n=1 Tax=Rhizobium laguerreae TaxID=1076926 RepID=UPI001C922752|nr:acyl carrier protein [Rhizobium laguerreae]MBY3370143.1 acyl carrier protein [Rhizobium laguerreae]MBY3390955.1 acyl carrier protein [Rhizobium laguerreae]MBY3404617.1 acyl carrier protein [Rhizobium laguerreae]MBY3411549.1 acyl carrier protein [Rhizobium laguerreae]MBY3517292.1 acyl carrier protein [Rhizobium laguerreae]
MFDNPRPSIRTFIIENFLFGDKSTMPEDVSSLIENEILDSTGVLELVAFIEETFGFTMADDEIVPANLDSVVKIADFVLSKTLRASA